MSPESEKKVLTFRVPWSVAMAHWQQHPRRPPYPHPHPPTGAWGWPPPRGPPPPPPPPTSWGNPPQAMSTAYPTAMPRYRNLAIREIAKNVEDPIVKAIAKNVLKQQARKTKVLTHVRFKP